MRGEIPFLVTVKSAALGIGDLILSSPSRLVTLYSIESECLGDTCEIKQATPTHNHEVDRSVADTSMRSPESTGEGVCAGPRSSKHHHTL
jgi:hypothetical protein